MKMSDEQLKLYEALTPLQKSCVAIKMKHRTLSNGEIYTRANITSGVTKHYARQYGFNVFNHPNVKAFLKSIEMETIDDLIMGREEMLTDLTEMAGTTLDDVMSMIHSDDNMMNVETGEIYTGMESITIKKLSDIPEHAKKAIKKIKQTKYGIEVELVDPLIARKMIADMQGFNAPTKTEISGVGGKPIEFRDMSDDDLLSELSNLGLSDD